MTDEISKDINALNKYYRCDAGASNMARRNTFIPLDIQCFWCNGHMERGITTYGELNCVTYFCKRCGGVSHFAVNDRQKISSIEVKYLLDKVDLKGKANE